MSSRVFAPSDILSNLARSTRRPALLVVADPPLEATDLSACPSLRALEGLDAALGLYLLLDSAEELTAVTAEITAWNVVCSGSNRRQIRHEACHAGGDPVLYEMKVSRLVVIPLSLWGKDHWSAFHFAALAVVNQDGRIYREDYPKLRCDPELHPAFQHPRAKGDTTPPKTFPTRLKGTVTVEPHDDWSCIEDAIREGLLTNERPPNVTPRFVLTSRGVQALTQIMAHKGRGRHYSTFVFDDTLTPEGAAL